MAKSASYCSECGAILPVLTERQRDVIIGVAQGLSNAEIAQELQITPKTVKNYVSDLFQELSIRNRTQLVMIALRHGYVTMHRPRRRPRSRHSSLTVSRYSQQWDGRRAG